MKFSSDDDRDNHENDREKKWNSPTELSELFFTELSSAGENHAERNKKPESCRRLNEGCVKSARAIRCVFRYVGCGSTVFTTEGKTLKEAKEELKPI